MRKIRLQKLLDTLSPFGDEVEDIFKSVDDELQTVASKLKEDLQVKTLDEVNTQFKKLKKSFEPLLTAFEELKNNLNDRDKKFLSFWNEKLSEISDGYRNTILTADELKAKEEEINKIKEKIREIQNTPPPDFTPFITESEKKLKALIGNLESKNNVSEKELQDSIKEVADSIQKVREIANNRLGGASHLQINVNSSVMSRKYTDINFVSDTAIRWSASDDSTYKRVNIRASLISGGAGGSSLEVKEVDGNPDVSNVSVIRVSNGTLTDDGGGQVTISTGGGGSGITRVSSTISVSSTFGATALTDYVAFANVGLVMTLPTAVGNSNLYTVKNYSASSVLVVSAQGIDDSPSALMPSNYESLSFISNGSIYGVV